MVKPLTNLVGAAIYHTLYVPFWLCWNLVGKHIVRTGMTVIVHSEEDDRTDQSAMYFSAEECKKYIAEEYVRHLKKGRQEAETC